MRHPAAAEMVRNIKGFIMEHESKMAPIDEYVPVVHDFLARTSAQFAAHELWKVSTRMK